MMQPAGRPLQARRGLPAALGLLATPSPSRMRLTLPIPLGAALGQAALDVARTAPAGELGGVTALLVVAAPQILGGLFVVARGVVPSSPTSSVSSAARRRYGR
jgi:hypothetical protein